MGNIENRILQSTNIKIVLLDKSQKPKEKDQELLMYYYIWNIIFKNCQVIRPESPPLRKEVRQSIQGKNKNGSVMA